MPHHFQFKGLPLQQFAPLFTCNAQQLANRHVKWIRADSSPGYPCRVSLVDADIGERLLALSYEHQPAHSPYRASGPIFVRVNASNVEVPTNEIPKMLLSRTLSVRAYDRDGLMLNSDIVNGPELSPFIQKLLEDPQIEYLHLHNARPGCFLCAAYRV